MRPVFACYPQIAAAWLFGSVALRELRPRREIDIGTLQRDPGATAADV